MGMSVVDRLRRVGRDLYQVGLVSTRAGNLSVRIEDTIVMTRSGAMLAHLEPSDLVEVPVSGQGDRDADVSGDLVLHREIYARTPARAVVHAHGPDTIARSFGPAPIEPVDHEGGLLLGPVPVVEESDPRTLLAGQVGELTAGGARIVVVRGHGSFAAGDSIEAAAHWATCLDHSCRVLLRLDR